MTTIIGLKLNNRIETSSQLQDILSDFGCYIKTRIGLHDVHNNVCKENGIILLEIINTQMVPILQKALCSIDGIELQQMVFEDN